MSTSERPIERRYRDPLDEIWLDLARRVGLRVARSQSAYASTDGRGQLTLGTPSTLDPDDCLAQMILHELCHGLVEGPEAFDRPDWGLDNTSEQDIEREYGALRLQASLLDPFGLRAVLAPTTEHRRYYDNLPADPLSLEPASPTILRARRGRSWAERPPFAPHLLETLDRTAVIVRSVAEGLRADSSSLFAAVTEQPPSHPSTGWPLAATDTHHDRNCGRCAFAYRSADTVKCRQAGKVVEANHPACHRYEVELECQTCGACCREAYGAVEVEPGDPFVHAHPDLVAVTDGRHHLVRVGSRCSALEGGAGTPLRCRIYADRPRTCREFERGGEHCITARRRLGLSL